jgi:hypothetical protein
LPSAQVELPKLQAAISIACRLGFATRLPNPAEGDLFCPRTTGNLDKLCMSQILCRILQRSSHHVKAMEGWESERHRGLGSREYHRWLNKRKKERKKERKNSIGFQHALGLSQERLSRMHHPES